MRIAFVFCCLLFSAIPNFLVGNFTNWVNFRDTAKTKLLIFERSKQDSIYHYWNSTLVTSFEKVQRISNRNSNQIDSLSGSQIASVSRKLPIKVNFELGRISNSRFEEFLGSDNGQLHGILMTSSRANHLPKGLNSQDSVNFSDNHILQLGSNPQLRALLKFDWFGSDTLRNILLLSPMNDSALDLTATLTQWVQIPEVKNVEINAKDSFLPKRDPSNTVDENYGYNVFLPEMYLMPLPCFHAPIFIEFWGVDNATVYRDKDKLEGLSFSNVINILADFKSHIQDYHSAYCLTESLKLRLYMKNKDVKVAELVRFVDLITDLNYKLEVK